MRVIGPWRTARIGRDIHVVPINDTHNHKKNRCCHCQPRFQDENEDPAIESDDMPLVVIHQAYDGRE